MNLMKSNRLIEIMKIVTDVLIAILVLGIIASIFGMILQFIVRNDFNTFLRPESYYITLEIIGFSLIPISNVVLLLIFFQLRKVFISISANQVFERKNISRVRSMGYAVIILGFIKLLRPILALLSHGHDSRIYLNIGSRIIGSFQFFFAGFVVLVLAELFRLGVEMYNEQKLTV